MNKKLVIGLLGISLSAIKAEVQYFFDKADGKEAIICEKAMPALQNPNWHAKKETELMKNSEYHNPEQGKHLHLIEGYPVTKESKGNISHLKCRHYKSIKR